VRHNIAEGSVNYYSSAWIVVVALFLLGFLNDLWKFDGTQWTWVSGSSLAGQNGVYGTKGVAAASNVVGARQNAISWIDSSNNLWLFGGEGYAASGSFGMMLLCVCIFVGRGEGCMLNI
jgi:hypothetical protein